jgi:hypothetical protein
MKQNQKAKICFVIYIAGFFFNKKFCYEVFAKQKKRKESRIYYFCPPPEGVSNPQPVLRHVSAVSAPDWSTGSACVAVTPICCLAEELEPLWFTALLLRVPAVFGCAAAAHQRPGAPAGKEELKSTLYCDFRQQT